MTDTDGFSGFGETPAGGPDHLLQYLWDAYVAFLQTELDARKAAGTPAATIEQAKMRAPAWHFVQWAAAHLSATPVTESFFVEGNLGIRLADGTRVSVCPGEAELHGTMQDAHDIAVTSGGPAAASKTAPGSNTMRI